MKKHHLIGGLCALALVTGTLTGCQNQTARSDRKLTVGKVDTGVLLRDDPEYQNLSIEYMKENTALRGKFMEQGKSLGQGNSEAKNELQKKYMGEQKALDDKWMNKTQGFLESRHSSIRDSAQKIAESKDIDMVIIDSREYPTTEWGGVDITPDLSLAMTQGGGAKPAPSGTPAKKDG